MESVETETRGNQEKKTEDNYRISISKAAERAVVELMDKVNQDSAAGQVNRMQVASWVLVKFAEDATSEDIKAMRRDHVNDMDLLEHVFKQSKESGKIHPEMREFLRKIMGVDGAVRKSAKKGLQKDIINDDIPFDDRRRNEANS